MSLAGEIRWAVGHVLASRERRRFLLSGGIGGIRDLLRFLRVVVPQAASALAAIEADTRGIPDDELRAQALASVQGKAYHVAGGCILATFLGRDAARRYIEVVAPLESIYDYLDNLCDRHPGVTPAAYPVLHEAIADALDPTRGTHDYYARGPSGSDGGYLARLVQRSQHGIRALAGHEALAARFAEAAAFYSGLQSYKHLPPGQREAACLEWYSRDRERFADLEWFEFAAAAGSQFQVYVPLFLLATGEPASIDAGYDAYFPAVAALHVLLDAFIDQSEDREHGELNLYCCYGEAAHARQRFGVLSRRAFASFDGLPHPSRHRFLLRTMALFYLTHPKLYDQNLDEPARALLASFERPAS